MVHTAILLACGILWLVDDSTDERTIDFCCVPWRVMLNDIVFQSLLGHYFSNVLIAVCYTARCAPGGGAPAF